MKNFKPIILILFAALLIFAFCSCGARKKTESKSSHSSVTNNDIENVTNNDVKLKQNEEVKSQSSSTLSEDGTINTTSTTKFNTVFDKEGKPHAIPIENTTNTTTRFNNKSHSLNSTAKNSKSELSDKSKSSENDKSNTKNKGESELETKEPKPPNNSIKDKIINSIVIIGTGLIAGTLFFLYLFRKNERSRN